MRRACPPLFTRGVLLDVAGPEVQPAPDPGAPSNPRPVHTRLLVERGICLLVSLNLEQLVADRVHTFLFVALPVTIAGATGSMMDPLAVV